MRISKLRRLYMHLSEMSARIGPVDETPDGQFNRGQKHALAHALSMISSLDPHAPPPDYKKVLKTPEEAKAAAAAEAEDSSPPSG